VRAKNWSMLVAVLVTCAIALLDAQTGGHAILLGLLIAGPLLAAASLDAQPPAVIGLYAPGLAVLLGIPDGIFATTDHLLRCLGWRQAPCWVSSSPTAALSRNEPCCGSAGSPRSPSGGSCGRFRLAWAGSPWPCATCRPPRTPWSAATSTRWP
jgi:hypothetical protein